MQKILCLRLLSNISILVCQRRVCMIAAEEIKKASEVRETFYVCCCCLSFHQSNVLVFVGKI